MCPNLGNYAKNKKCVIAVNLLTSQDKFHEFTMIHIKYAIYLFWRVLNAISAG